MTYKTHILTSMIFGESFLLVSEYQINDNYMGVFVFFFFLIFSSILPDIDEKKSKISQILPGPIVKLFNLLDHRGFTHNIFGFIFMSFLAYIIIELTVPNYSVIAIKAFVIGYLSHIFGDMVTYSGVYFIPGFKTRIPIFNNFIVGSYQELKVYFLLTWIQIGIILFGFYSFRFGGF